jgi:hypothetical protein
MRKCSSARASFHVGHAEQLRVSDGGFETVLMFEIIEHLKHPRLALAEAHRVLCEKGLLLLSTPNGAYSANRHRPLYPFHEREYLDHELVDLLRECGFEVLEFFGKSVMREKSMSCGLGRWRTRLLCRLMVFDVFRWLARAMPPTIRHAAAGKPRSVLPEEVKIKLNDHQAENFMLVCERRHSSE